jgi:hypothetical protein
MHMVVLTLPIKGHGELILLTIVAYGDINSSNNNIWSINISYNNGTWVLIFLPIVPNVVIILFSIDAHGGSH